MTVQSARSAPTASPRRAARGGRALATWLPLATAGLLAGCAEQPQTAGTRKVDVPAYAGVAGRADGAGLVGGQAAAGWKTGDAAGWESQMRTRAQGQDEYSRATTP